MGCFNITTNAGGIPYINSASTNVTTESVNIVLGFRKLQPVGYFTIRITDAIPSGTTASLPVTITLNGVARSITLPNGIPVTASDLIDTSIVLIFNDSFNGITALMSRSVD